MALNTLFRSKCCKTHSRCSSSVTTESPGQNYSDCGNGTNSDSDSDSHNYSDTDSDSDEVEDKTPSSQVMISDMTRKEEMEKQALQVWRKIQTW